ncbi:hypothetical protein BJY04DRAFT_109451 [Aspergillus karnatakaensis]|uniref:uncharacterized protein n=1 Tax=Aspergillus karnatakaensis TaxID=1810916 RepID=UPI003CCDCBC8
MEIQRNLAPSCDFIQDSLPALWTTTPQSQPLHKHKCVATRCTASLRICQCPMLKNEGQITTRLTLTHSGQPRHSIPGWPVGPPRLEQCQRYERRSRRSTLAHKRPKSHCHDFQPCDITASFNDQASPALVKNHSIEKTSGTTKAEYDGIRPLASPRLPRINQIWELTTITALRVEQKLEYEVSDVEKRLIRD